MNLAEVHELADAVLLVWYPGEEGGNAIADILFGKVSPSGRLPITFPKSLDQLPPYEDYSMKGRTYKYMDEDPLYPFGFGLSYGSFTYGELKISKANISKNEEVTVSVEVTNEGEVESDEVVQLYVSDDEASVDVPNSQLFGVQRIKLAPKESKNVSFTLKPNAFQLVNNDGQRVLEPGKFTVHVGGSSPMKRSQELGAPTMSTGTIALN